MENTVSPHINLLRPYGVVKAIYFHVLNQSLEVSKSINMKYVFSNRYDCSRTREMIANIPANLISTFLVNTGCQLLPILQLGLLERVLYQVTSRCS